MPSWAARGMPGERRGRAVGDKVARARRILIGIGGVGRAELEADNFLGVS